MRELRFMLFIVAAMLWNTVTAYDFEVDGIYYNIISSVDKTVEVSGYVRNIGFKGNIVIPERINGYSVTTIGNYAFKACGSLTGINIPNSVVNIGWDAFYSCRNLKTVVNLSDLKISEGSSSNGYVGYYAEKVINADEQIGNFFFATTDGVHTLVGYIGNEDDQELVLPNSYKGENYKIGNYAFKDCTNLTSIAIPDSVTSIGEYAFNGCRNLKTVVNLSDLKISKGSSSNGYVGYYAEKVIKADGQVGNFFFATTDGVHTLVGYIGKEDDQELVLPNSYKGENYKIGNRVFEYCTNLTSITIPDSVTSIGEYAFYSCRNLKTVVNLSDLEISKGSFSNGCVGYYAEKVIKADNQISNFVFATTDGIHSLVYYIRNEDDQELVLPNSYKGENYKIGNRVFEDCINLTSITIPDSVTRIGEYAFNGCSNLTDITIPNSVTSIGEYAFNGCSNLTDITIPNSVMSIGEYAFYDCSNLTDITIPNSVTSIGKYAFNGCINLKTVVNLSDLKISKGSSSNGYVGYYAEKVIKADGQVGNFFFATTDGVHTLVGYIGNEDDQELVLPNSYKGENYKIGNRVFEDCTNLTSITIPDSVTSIGEYAFYGCSNLTDITIPNSVTSIGKYAFNGCINLKTVINFSDIEIYRGSSSNGYVGYYAKKVIKADGQVGNFFFATTDGVHILVGYIGNENNLVLPDNYGGESYKIGYGVFRDYTNLTSIVLPDSVMGIGDYAFYGCTHLASITIPNSVVSIEQYAFYGCTDLASITIPNSVVSIEQYAFYGCTRLASIIIPNSMVSIEQYAFYGCENMKTVVNLSDFEIVKGTSDYGYVGFYAEKVATKDDQIGNFFFATTDGVHSLIAYVRNRDDKKIVLPENYKGENYEIGNDVFLNCANLTSVTLSNSVTSIGKYAFSGCSNLTDFTIPNSVTSIGEFAFSGCSNLTDLTIPSSVTSIGKYAFNGCINLKTVINFSDIEIYKGYYSNGYVGYYESKFINADEQVGDFFFATNDGIHSLVGCIGNEDDKTIVLPENYKGENYKIGYSVFEDCTNLTSITIPNSVTSIGEDAFRGCTNLTDITIPNSVTSIGECAFTGCTNLTDITIPNSVTSIGEYAFSGCSNLTDITIPNSVTSIGTCAFSGCSNLTDITIPNSVVSIGASAFRDCINLKTVINFSDIEIYKGYSSNGYVGYYAEKVIKADDQISNFVFATTDGIHSLVYYIRNEDDKDLLLPNSYKGEIYMIGNRVFEDCTNLTNITIPDSVTSIGEYAFSGCTNLTDITIPNSVVSIGASAFSGCKTLTSIAIPDSVTSIGDSFSRGCTNLTSVILPSSVTSIGEYAFDGCVNLTDITIPNSVVRIGASAFSGCKTLTSIAIPDSVTGIGDSFCRGCTNLTNITLPNSIRRIGFSAFYDCINLRNITIPNSVTSIEYDAFYSCRNLKTVVNFSDLKISKGSSSNGYVGYYAKKVINADGQVGNFFFVTTNDIHSLVDYLGTGNDKKIVLPENYKGENYGIGNRLFQGCTELTSIILPGSLTSIGEYAFDACTNLTDITIPNSVVSIGASAFSSCKTLTNITIPSSVTSIGESAFEGCTNLTNVACETEELNLGWFENLTLKSLTIGEKTTNVLNQIETRPTKTIWLTNTPPAGYAKAEGVINYVANKQYSFNNTEIYPYLSSIFEVDGMTYVPVNPSERTCDLIDYCSGNVNDSVKVCSTVSFKGLDMTVKNVMPYTFYENLNIKNLVFLNQESIGEFACFDCKNLKSVTLGEGITDLKESAFKNTALDQIVIPGSVRSIDDDCFYGCTNLKEFSIPKSVISIGDNVFTDCSSLTNVVIEDRTEVLSLGSKGSSPLFADCPLESVYIGGKISYNTSSDKGYSPFYRNTSLHSVVIGDKEEAIYDNEFYGCTALKNVTIGNGVKSIGNWAFSGCSGLDYFAFGGSMNSIGEEAFSDCTNMTQLVSYAMTPPICGTQALDDINKWNCTLKVPESYKTAYMEADQWKDFFFIEDVLSIQKYQLTYIVDGKVYCIDSIPLTLEIIPVVPTKEGHTFSGWSGLPVTMPANDVVVEGSFSVNSYLLTYKIDGEEYSTDSVVYGTELVQKEVLTKEGYTFSGWSELPVTMPANDVVVEGSFSVNSYLLIYKVDGEEYSTDSVVYGTELVQKEVLTKEGHTFSGWSELPVTMPANDVVVEGSFSVNSYLLIYKVDGEEYSTDSVVYGTELVQKEVLTKEGYTFSGWSELLVTMPANDVVVEGSYSLNSYLLTYMVDGEEYATEEVAYGSAITLKEAPVKEGYLFSGWSEVPETMPAKDIVVTGSFEVDGIEAILTDKLVDVYTLQGVMVRRQIPVEDLKRELPTGIYIINGKKVAVRRKGLS